MPRKPNAKPAAKQETKPETVYGEKQDGYLSGNLTEDPELRFTPSGLPVAALRIAVNDRIRNEDTGEWEEAEAQYYTVTAWRYLAEHAAETLQRGDRIVATGYYQDETYINRDGEKITVTKFTAQDLGASLLWKSATIKRTQRAS